MGVDRPDRTYHVPFQVALSPLIFASSKEPSGSYPTLAMENFVLSSAGQGEKGARAKKLRKNANVTCQVLFDTGLYYC